jgi:hypothetical protein
VVGWAIEDHLRTDLVETALRRAVTLRGRQNVVLLRLVQQGIKARRHASLKQLRRVELARCFHGGRV